MKLLKNRWWRKSRPSTKSIQLNKNLPPCLESYVPWWAWPLEWISNFFYGKIRIGYIMDWSEDIVILDKNAIFGRFQEETKKDADNNL